MSEITFDTSKYMQAHGTEPSGKRTWAFSFDGWKVFFAGGEYAEAQSLATRKAEKAGKTLVYVHPST